MSDPLRRGWFGLLLVCGAVLSACGPSAPPATAVATATTTVAAPTVEPTATAVPTLLFSGEEAYALLQAQVKLGDRYPGSEGHLVTRDFIRQQLMEEGWQVDTDAFDYHGFAAENIIGKANVGAGPVVILGAHYDTRRLADQSPDPNDALKPVPGAVDGASGVAVLLELARTLDLSHTPHEVWLTFFDVEDNGYGGIEGWDYIAGSAHMAENLVITPTAVIVVDMVGQTEQTFYYEHNSNPPLQEALWDIAAKLGYGAAFIPEFKYTMMDDHLPFTEKGITAVDIIDFDYPHWHTVGDTADKATPASLEQVGRTIEVWLEQYLDR